MLKNYQNSLTITYIFFFNLKITGCLPSSDIYQLFSGEGNLGFLMVSHDTSICNSLAIPNNKKGRKFSLKYTKKGILRRK